MKQDGWRGSYGNDSSDELITSNCNSTGTFVTPDLKLHQTLFMKFCSGNVALFPVPKD